MNKRYLIILFFIVFSYLLFQNFSYSQNKLYGLVSGSQGDDQGSFFSIAISDNILKTEYAFQQVEEVSSTFNAAPALGGLFIIDTLGVSISANSIPYDSILEVNLPIYNFSQDFAIPAGSTTIRVNMGRKFHVNPAFPVSSFPLNTYFSWTSSEVNGELIITGDQIEDLPHDFVDVAEVRLNADSSCSSIVSSSFIADNHSSIDILADVDVFGDPAIGQMYFAKTSGLAQDANNLLMAPAPDLYDINIPFYNLNQANPVPNGTINLRISLGTKLVLAAGFNLATAPLSSYFSWAQSTVNGNEVLTGTQIAEIPADFNGIAVFRLKGDSACSSKVVSDIIITIPSVFTDDDLQNNNATLQYNFPVTLAHTRVNVTCNGTANGIINITSNSGTSVTTTGPSGYSNTTGLPSGINNFSLNNLAPGIYSITASATSDTPLAGCSQLMTVIITQPPLLTLTVSAFENNACHHGISGSISVVAYGGVPPYNYGIIGPTVNSTGVSTGIFTGLAAGDYTITVTDNNDCNVSATAGITEPSVAAADISLGSDVSGTLFAAEGVTQTIVYNVSEIAGNVAVGDTLRINKVSGFTIGINPTLLDTILGGTTYSLSNPMWKIENSNPSFISIIFTDMLNVLNPGILQCNQRVNVAIMLTRNTSDISVFTLSARLRKANGEINLSNNLNSVIFAAQ